MSRYTFRMEKVLRVRRLQEDAARAGVGAARSAERGADTALAGSLEHYRELADSSVLATHSAPAFLGHLDRVAFRATGVTLAQERRRVAVEATAAALTEWRETNRRVEALERLDERRRDEHGIEVRRAEDAGVDELLVARARRSA